MTVIEPGGGEVIGDAPDRRVEILSDVPELAATLSRFAPGRDGADLHVHHAHTDVFFVLEGELTVRLGPSGRPASVPTGALAMVPPDVVHGFRNASDAQMRYLNLHVPGQRFPDYLRGLRDGVPFSYDQFDPPEDGGRPPSLASIGGPEAAIEALGLRIVDGVDEEVHTHDDHVESLWVLAGEVSLTVDGRSSLAGPGTFAQFVQGVPHAVSGGRFLSLRTPNPDWR